MSQPKPLQRRFALPHNAPSQAARTYSRHATGRWECWRGRSGGQSMMSLKIFATFCFAVLTGTVLAQEARFPQRGANIEITVLFPAGSSADVTARLLAEGMAKQLDTTVIV